MQGEKAGNGMFLDLDRCSLINDNEASSLSQDPKHAVPGFLLAY